MLRKSEAPDSVECFCENPTALILVVVDHIKKLQLKYMKSSHDFPLATGKLEAEECEVCKVLATHPDEVFMMHSVPRTQ